MHNDKQGRDLLELVHRGLTGQAETLDPVVCARLRQARSKAIDAGSVSSPWRRTQRFLFGSGQLTNPLWRGFAVATVTTMVVSLWAIQGMQGNATRLAPDSGVQGNESVVSPMDVLMSNEDMDFLENLELYEWLAAEYG